MQGGRDKFKKGRSYTYSETDVDELEESDRRCANFLRECLLPIAVQTNALVRERERERERREREREVRDLPPRASPADRVGSPSPHSRTTRDF